MIIDSNKVEMEKQKIDRVIEQMGQNNEQIVVINENRISDQIEQQISNMEKEIADMNGIIEQQKEQID